EGQTMSKTLGNFYTLRDLLVKGWPPEVVRYLLVSVPYRKQLNFTMDGLRSAATAIERLRNYRLRLETARFPEGKDDRLSARTALAVQQFEASLDGDLNTAEALAAVFEFVRDTNTAMDAGEFREGNVAEALNVVSRFDGVFDVLRPTVSAGVLSDTEIEALIAERTAARKARDFARADQVRAELLEKGVVLEDTKDGVRWKRK
ncbi:MAG TPA: DALR domain-containing protein, partial [Bryobacteraceae bacterium]|nr:DALR domain-containing protein [Bryobacteraceae bacterium]